MMNSSMHRSTPYLVGIGLALATNALPATAQRAETIARSAARAPANDTLRTKLRRLERTIDSLVRRFHEDELSFDQRWKLRQAIDERFAEFTALRAAASSQPGDARIFIRRAPDEFTFGSGGGAMSVLPRIAQQDVVPGWVGIVVNSPTQIRIDNGEMFQRYLMYPEVTSVDPSSPAERAGVVPGDTLMAFNGQDVRSEEISLTRLLQPKATLRVRLRRDGKTKEVPMVVAAVPARIKLRREDEIRYAGTPALALGREIRAMRPPSAPAPASPSRPVAAALPPGRVFSATPVLAPMAPFINLTTNGVLGAQMVTVTEALKRSLDIPQGVLVTAVPVGSPAGESGLEEGDVVLRVGSQPIRTVLDVREQVRRAFENGERSVDVELRRGKARRTLTLRW
jgi:membrane-associated protease RseP (regulator of RpoE activity)